MEPSVVGIACVCIVAVVAIVFGRQMSAKGMGASMQLGRGDDGSRSNAKVRDEER